MKAQRILLGFQVAAGLFMLCSTRSSWAASPSDARMPAQDVCRSSASMFVGPCRSLRARMQIGADTISVWVWPVGTKRYLGYPDWANCKLPTNLPLRATPSNVVYANIVVRPLSVEKPGHMQFVCIASASHIVVRNAPY
jgi:hypothetical protein